MVYRSGWATTGKLRYVLAAVAFAIYGCSANAKFCEVTGGNYLQNSDFSTKTASGGVKHWTATQHAGETSFEVNYDGVEVTIDKIGSQPWMMLKQRLRDTDLAGEKAAFTAEIKLDLQQPAIFHGFKKGGGLQLTAAPSSSSRLLLKSTLDHTPHMGKTDWEKVQVVVKFPPKTSTVEVSFLHQADGVLQVRNPSLQLVDESGGKCKRTKIEK
ncbi:MAG: hypothetical protein ACJASY_001833 [Halioglobus sp.]|jgi:hypothetical protein